MQKVLKLHDFFPNSFKCYSNMLNGVDLQVGYTMFQFDQIDLGYDFFRLDTSSNHFFSWRPFISPKSMHQIYSLNMDNDKYSNLQFISYFFRRTWIQMA